jgi:toxin FitB
VLKAVSVVGGRLTVGKLAEPVSYADSLLAATAITHGPTLVTRNTRDVEVLPVPMLNPWDGTGAA